MLFGDFRLDVEIMLDILYQLLNWKQQKQSRAEVVLRLFENSEKQPYISTRAAIWSRSNFVGTIPTLGILLVLADALFPTLDRLLAFVDALVPSLGVQVSF